MSGECCVYGAGRVVVLERLLCLASLMQHSLAREQRGCRSASGMRLPKLSTATLLLLLISSVHLMDLIVTLVLYTRRYIILDGLELLVSMFFTLSSHKCGHCKQASLSPATFILAFFTT
jgi:hypothetical protein